MADNVGAILDTSYFVGVEQARPMKPGVLPPVVAVSVVTLAELRLAVLNASNVSDQGKRLRTLEQAIKVQAVPIDENIAFEWAVLRSAARSLSQSRINDLWIAATALALQVPVVTQDDGFVRLAEVGGPKVIRI